MSSTLITTSPTATLPLTTVFTAPAQCTSSWTYEAQWYNNVSGGLLMQNMFSDALDRLCFPSGFTNCGRTRGAQVYSPGYCPNSYTSVGGFHAGGTTTAFCCQIGYTWISIISLDFAGCVSTYPVSNGPTTVRGRSDPATFNTTTVTGPVTMWGQPIVVAFQQEDLSLFVTSTSISSSATVSSSATNALPVGTSTPSSATASPWTTNGVPVVTSAVPSSSGMKPNTAAGIGAGATAVAFCLLGVAIFFIFRQQRIWRLRTPGNKDSSVQAIVPMHNIEGLPELPGAHSA